MIRIIRVIVICLLATGCKQSQTEQWYTTAPSGLNLRATASPASQALILIPYGEAVEVLEKFNEAQVIGGQSGSWFRVQYKGKVGFLFSGYLSSTPPPAQPVPEIWSAHQGHMNWHDAQARCAATGRRLPTIEELQEAHQAGSTTNWETEGWGWYWSSSHKQDDEYFLLNVKEGSVETNFQINHANVRCRR